MIQHRRAVLSSLLAVAGLSACGATERSWELRFRLKVNAVSGGGDRHGVGAFRAKYTRYPNGMLNRPSVFRTALWGEAVDIDLGEKGRMFAILGSIGGIDGPNYDPGREYSLTQLLPAAQRTRHDIPSGRAFETVGAIRRDMFLPRTIWPTFIRFPEPTQKSSGRLVIPAEQNYRLSDSTRREAESAIDLRITSVAIELTADEPTLRIEQVLPWVSELPGARPGRHREGGPQHPLSDRFSYRHFKMEGYAR